MSGRLMKKVLKEQEAANQQHEKKDLYSDDDSESSNTSPLASSVNPFDLLDDQSQDENDLDIAGGSSSGYPEVEESLTEKVVLNDTVSQSNAKTKINNKKNEKEDKILDKKNIESASYKMSNMSMFGEESSSPRYGLSGAIPKNETSGALSSSVLQVEPKMLNAETELRRIFGSKVVNSLGRSHQAGPSRQNRGGRRGNHNHRKTILVSPLEHWPRWDGSFSMEYLETKDHYHYFRYVQSSAYKQAQIAFESAKATHDLNGIANILLYHPYHVDSLITLAEYFKFSGEHQMSADATSKCLYALECAWHPMFSPLQDKCKLKYSHETNRPFFSTLFAHMKNMDRRGCHRCALEICKLLLSLDSDDPMGAMFCIDYFALRAEEYTWLERFSEEFKSDNSLWLFPNFSFSLAISRFCLEGSTDANEAEKTSSTDLMCHALMLHPPVLKKLVAKVPLKDQMWANILNHKFFSIDRTGVPSLDHLINIYVERSYIIWRLPDLQKFLRNSAMKVIDDLDHNRGDAKDWACVREEAFSSEKNEYDHLLVSDFSDSVQTMPPDNLQNFILDPQAMAMQNADQAINPPAVGRAPREVANRNALAVLLESILPWNHYGTSGAGEFEDEHNNDM
nr:PREDICTED: transcription factor 25 [Daucus carota subsp. sativus]